MEGLLERLRRERNERESVWKLLIGAILSAEVPGTSQSVAEMIRVVLSDQAAQEMVRAVLSRDRRATIARDSQSKCGIWFGRAGDFAEGIGWYSDVRCIAISVERVRKHFLKGTAWADKSIGELKPALQPIPGFISSGAPDGIPGPPIVLIGRDATMEVLEGQHGQIQPPGGSGTNGRPGDGQGTPHNARMAQNAK